MKITITKTSSRTCSTVAERSDGVRVKIPGYGPPIPVPPDLFHYIVEGELKLKRGFWGCVALGAILAGMEVIGGRQRPNAADRAKEIVKKAGQELEEAEHLTAAFLRLWGEGQIDNWDVARKYLASIWKPSKPSRGPVQEVEFARIRESIRKFEKNWQALPIEGSIKVEWS